MIEKDSLAGAFTPRQRIHEAETDRSQQRSDRDDIVPPASPEEQADCRRENAEDQRLIGRGDVSVLCVLPRGQMTGHGIGVVIWREKR